MEIKTSDLYFAGWLQCNLELARIDRTNPSRKVFVFSDPDNEAAELQDKWDTATAEVNAVDYADALRQLKNAVMRS